MPNWCTNRLTVLGPPERVDAFVKKAHGRLQKYKTDEWEIRMWEKSCAKARDEGKNEPTHPQDKVEVAVMSFHQLRPIPSRIEAGAYDPDGYDMEKRLWGCKWGACESKLVKREPGRAEYKFDTPWGPPEKLFEFLSSTTEWLDLTFVDSWGEEFPSRGRFALRAGVFLEQTYDSSDSAVFAEDDENAVETWRNQYLHQHAEFVMSVT